MDSNSTCTCVASKWSLKIVQHSHHSRVSSLNVNYACVLTLMVLYATRKLSSVCGRSCRRRRCCREWWLGVVMQIGVYARNYCHCSARDELMKSPEVCAQWRWESTPTKWTVHGHSNAKCMLVVRYVALCLFLLPANGNWCGGFVVVVGFVLYFCCRPPGECQ